MLKITHGKGFHIEFSNGHTVSVQFGYGNYCDNYDGRGFANSDFNERNDKLGAEGSRNAECAVFSPEGELIDLPNEFAEGDRVTNRTKPDDILKLMNWAAFLTPPNTGDE